jgi:GTP-binding protein HflX
VLHGLQERVAELHPNSVFVSASASDGLEPLRRALLAQLRRARPIAEIRIPAGNGKLLAEVHRAGEVIEERVDGLDMVLRARIDEATAGRLRSAGAGVSGGGTS